MFYWTDVLGGAVNDQLFSGAGGSTLTAGPGEEMLEVTDTVPRSILALASIEAARGTVSEDEILFEGDSKIDGHGTTGQAS